MKAFLVEKTGDKEFTADIKEIPIPKCAEEEIVIKVTYIIYKTV